MKREPRTEIVSVRLTPVERVLLDKMGGPTEVLRRAIQAGRSLPSPSGETKGCAVRLIEHSGGWLSQEGIVWANGVPGGSLTVCL